jgi:peroxiredoxin
MIRSRFLFLIVAFTVTQAAFCQLKFKVGDSAPDFGLQSPSGDTLRLSDLRGKVVLLDFWASWCPPCRMSNPGLTKLYKEFAEKGFEIFSVSLDSKKEPWERAIEKDNLIWKYHVSDLQGWENDVAIMYGVDIIPATFLIDKNGVIIGVDLSKRKLRKRIAANL